MRFADLTQLEKVFPSSSKIRAIYAFVRESLREDVKAIKFILCASLWHICALTCIHLSLVWNSHVVSPNQQRPTRHRAN